MLLFMKHADKARKIQGGIGLDVVTVKMLIAKWQK